jgi:hypothetical protein
MPQRSCSPLARSVSGVKLASHRSKAKTQGCRRVRKYRRASRAWPLPDGEMQFSLQNGVISLSCERVRRPIFLARRQVPPLY